jgi:hypothetical protein
MGSAKPEDKHSRCGIRSEVGIDGLKSCPYMVKQTNIVIKLSLILFDLWDFLATPSRIPAEHLRY